MKYFNDEEVREIQKLAKEAGNLILANYKTNTKFEKKSDDTPLTEIDLNSHAIIYNGLQKLTPNVKIPVVSEEGGHLNFEAGRRFSFDDRKDWGEYWLIDPLDGTRGFIEETDDFCVCIAYVKNNDPVFGLVYSPVLETYYMANSEDAAYKGKDGKWEQITTNKKSTKVRAVVGKHSVEHPKVTEHLLDLFGKNGYEVFGMGSALKFGLMAEGMYDYYPALGICSEWDTAAGAFILRAAGGYTIDIDGNPLKYNMKDDMLSPKFFAFSDIKFYQEGNFKNFKLR